jgi:hypothetical protein
VVLQRIRIQGVNMAINVGYSPQKNIKYSVFHVEGGLGKNVAATAMTKIIKKNHPDRNLVVVASYPEVFLNNPHIYRVYNQGSVSYFYEDYIENKDTLVFKHEPYFQSSHILKKQSLVKTWADMYNLKYTVDDILPELYYNMVQKKFVLEWSRERPILVLHTNGGPLTGQQFNYSWTRDMPYKLGLAIVEKYKDTHHIIQICRDQSQALPDTEVVTRHMSNLELFSVLYASTKRILIDSSLQHAAAAFNLSSSVFWIGTSPIVFGYNVHTNIQANKPYGAVKLPSSYLFDYQFSGEHYECPYMDVSEMFDLDKVVQLV